MKRLRRVLGILLALCLLLPMGGCGGEEGESFTVLLPSNITTLDPQLASGTAADWVLGSIFEGLCRVDKDGEAVPGVAERWDHNRDNTKWTFHLRKAYWSNGERVTADDFLFAICRALSPETGVADPADLYLIKNAEAYALDEVSEEQLGVTVESNRKLVIELAQSCEDFPLFTAGNHYLPCNREFFEECEGHYGQSAAYVLTNGPFTFSSIYAWDTDYGEREITVVAANDYRGEAEVQPASVSFLIDYDDLYDNDPLYGLDDNSVDLRLLANETQAETWQESGGKVLSIDNGVTGILLNADTDELSYSGMRRLFVQTLDRTALLAASGTLDREAAGIMPGIVKADGKDYYKKKEPCYAQQDMTVTETVSSLLELLDMDNLPNITLLYPQEDGSTVMGEISPEEVLSQWNTALGGAFNMEGLPRSTLEYRVANGNYTAAVYTLTAGNSTAFHVLQAFSSSASPQLFDNEDFDTALSSMAFTDESYTGLEQQLASEYIFYPLVRTETYFAIAPGVSGIQLTGDGRIDFTSARK